MGEEEIEVVDGIIVNCDSCGMRSASTYAVSFQSGWLTCIERRLDSRAPVHVSHAFAYGVTSCIFRFETSGPDELRKKL